MIAPGTEATQDVQPWPPCPYRLRAASAAELAAPLAPTVLCAFAYGAEDVPRSDDPRRVPVALPLLHGGRAGEIWESATPVRHGRDGALGYAENGAVLMLHLTLPAAGLDPEPGAAQLYAELLRETAARGYPHLLRIWNYLDDINAGDGDAERYRQFCAGRHRALSLDPGFEQRLPAASAIGTRGGGLSIVALAMKRPGIQIENPRQLSAFRYPRVYGVRSPSFARATLVPWADGAQLLVSGTASIVGHATAHAGDAPAQLRQTAANLDALLTQPALARLGTFAPELYTLYLRHADDLPALLPLLPELFGGAPLQVLGGDICRRELLLEVEAVYRRGTGARP